MFQDGNTALHKAAYNGYEEIVKLLIDYHAKVDIRRKVKYAMKDIGQ